MPKIGFDPKTLSSPVYEASADVGHAHLRCAFEPVVTGTVGVEAIFEGLRLADVERFKPRRPLNQDGPTQDVDATDRKKASLGRKGCKNPRAVSIPGALEGSVSLWALRTFWGSRSTFADA
jgi:hypothetical protein